MKTTLKEFKELMDLIEAFVRSFENSRSVNEKAQIKVGFSQFRKANKEHDIFFAMAEKRMPL